MPKQESIETAKSVKFEITDQIRFYFRQLKAGGLHGDHPTDIVKFLVRDQIVVLLEKDQLQRPESKG